MSQMRFFSAVPGEKTLHNLTVINIAAAVEEHLCWTLLPMENASLTLQSLASFKVKFVKIQYLAQVSNKNVPTQIPYQSREMHL